MSFSFDNPYSKNKPTVIDPTLLKYKDLVFLDEYLEVLKGEAYIREQAEREANRRDRQYDADARKKTAAARAKRIDDWVIRSLMTGTYLKMKGCRDGKGLRIVERVSSKNFPSTITCRQFFIFRAFDGTSVETLGQITEHMSDKITQIRIDGEWMPIGKYLDKLEATSFNG